jgi:hypothetical protein
MLFMAWLVVVRNAQFLAQHMPVWLRRVEPTGH